MNYVLNAKGNPVPEPDIRAWAKWFQKAENRVVDNTVLPNGLRVSTVFLGLDHSTDDSGILWETMIFCGYEEEYCERYRSRDEAVAGHARAVEAAKAHRRPAPVGNN